MRESLRVVLVWFLSPLAGLAVIIAVFLERPELALIFLLALVVLAALGMAFFMSPTSEDEDAPERPVASPRSGPSGVVRPGDPERPLERSLPAAADRFGDRPDRPLDRPGDRPSDPQLNEALVQLAQDLVGATTVDRFRQAVAAHLPGLLGVRRLWIASPGARGRQVIVPMLTDGPDDHLEADGREWTTFALKVGHETIGVLGIETSGGVTPRVRHMVRLVAPLVAQGMIAAQAVETLRETSVVDLMTGLTTRQEGMARLESEIKRSQRSMATMAVLMLDLDRFKAINDQYGHGTGDAMLAMVGRTIMRTLRASDIRVRWGGEEFLIALPETDLPRAQVVAAGLLREISAGTVEIPGGGTTSSTVSIGITLSRAGETDAAAMIRRADTALYHAKSAGRACIRVVLVDRTAHPTPGSAPAATAVPVIDPDNLPFPDRRTRPLADRRRVAGPGRRRSDPDPGPESDRLPASPA